MMRIEIATAYVAELLSQRSDLIAAWVGGSVVRWVEATRRCPQLAASITQIERRMDLCYS